MSRTEGATGPNRSGREGGDGPALAPWDRIAGALRQEQLRIRAAIASYPTPIAGCDEQFNDLLDRQARFAQEWRRYEAARETGTSSPAEFLATCSLLDPEAKRRLLP